jgi:hypothetical protein
MVKKLLLLAFTAVAGEAMAEDAQCVPERSAMVETIRAYARSDVGILGPQGISDGRENEDVRDPFFDPSESGGASCIFGCHVAGLPALATGP